MTTPTYPEELPVPSQFKLTPFPQVLASNTDIGPKAFRRRSRQPGAFAAVEFRYLETEYSIFVEWFKTALLYGHKWFWIPLPSPNGLVPLQARFISKPTATLGGHRFWTVTGLLEIYDRFVPEETILILTSMPYPYMLEDNIDIASDFESGFCVRLLPIESVDLTGDFEAGGLTVTTTYVTYSSMDPGVDLTGDFEAGELTVTTTYVTYSPMDPGVDLTGDFEAGELTVTTTYVTYSNWIPENIDLAADFEGGTLEIV